MKEALPLLFSALLFVPWLSAELAGRCAEQRRARTVSAVGALLNLLLAVLLVAGFYAREQPSLRFMLALPGDLALHFVLDTLNAPLLIVLSGLTGSVVLGGPSAALTPQRLRAFLRLEGLTLLLLASADLLLFALAYSLVLIPTRKLTPDPLQSHAGRAVKRVFKIYQWFGLCCFLGALAMLGAALGPQIWLAGSLQLDIAALSPTLQTCIFALLLCGTLARMGLVPLHSWLPAALEQGSLLSIAFLASMRTGFYTLARFVIPLFPHLSESAQPILTALALCSAVYGALLALAQYDLRRMVGFLIVSQSGIMLVGLSLGDAHAAAGTLLYWLGFTVATMGLSLMIAALRARTGACDMRALGGLVRRVPQLSAHFFLFGLATIAVPGTIAFPAEDMLIHGALEAHPLLTIVMIIAMVLNAVTIVKAFAHTFLGQARQEGLIQGALSDLLPRERFASIALLIALICGGLFPQLLLDAQAQAAERLAHIQHSSEHAQR